MTNLVHSAVLLGEATHIGSQANQTHGIYVGEHLYELVAYDPDFPAVAAEAVSGYGRYLFHEFFGMHLAVTTQLEGRQLTAVEPQGMDLLQLIGDCATSYTEYAEATEVRDLMPAYQWAQSGPFRDVHFRHRDRQRPRRRHS